CCRRRTTSHRTRWSTALFWGAYPGLARHRLIRPVDILLQVICRNARHPGDARQRELLQQQLVDQLPGLRRDDLLGGVRYELTATVLAQALGLAVGDPPILDGMRRATPWTLHLSSPPRGDSIITTFRGLPKFHMSWHAVPFNTVFVSAARHKNSYSLDGKHMIEPEVSPRRSPRGRWPETGGTNRCTQMFETV